MYLALTETQKVFIDEVSALSGISRNVIREAWEFSLLNWAEKIAAAGDGLTNLEIPFLGNVAVKYTGDRIEDSGEVTTQAAAFVSLLPSFKKMIGDIHDGGDSTVTELLQKKIENALLTLSLDEH